MLVLSVERKKQAELDFYSLLISFHTNDIRMLKSQISFGVHAVCTKRHFSRVILYLIL